MKNILLTGLRLIGIKGDKLQQGVLTFGIVALIVGFFVCLFAVPQYVLPVMVVLFFGILIAVVANLAWYKVGEWMGGE